jgi:hypothetical protein
LTLLSGLAWADKLNTLSKVHALLFDDEGLQLSEQESDRLLTQAYTICNGDVSDLFVGLCLCVVAPFVSAAQAPSPTSLNFGSLS